MSQLKDMRILITGVQGQVGFELLKNLVTTGAELVIAARKAPALPFSGFKSVALDLSNDESIRAVIYEVKPQLIINAAAYTAVDKAETEVDLADQVNSRALKVLTEVMKELGGSIIHFSTDYVYNPGHDQPNLETDSTNPSNVYARSKLAGETAIQDSGIPHIIFRTSWVYGTNGSNFVKTMLRIGRERQNLRVVSDQVGSPTAAATVAQVVTAVLNQGYSDPLAYIAKHSGIYNLCDRGFTSWNEFAKEIFRQSRVLGVDLTVESVDEILTKDYQTAALRPLNSRMSLEKLNKTFGIVTPPWQQCLALFLQQSLTKLY